MRTIFGIAGRALRGGGLGFVGAKGLFGCAALFEMGPI